MRGRPPRLLVTIAAAAGLLAGCGGGDETAGDQPADGREVFTSSAEPSCAGCHTLADAGATGTVGPNLDTLQPSREQVIQAVTNGSGVMPAFGDQLSEDEIEAVAEYVSGAASG